MNIRHYLTNQMNSVAIYIALKHEYYSKVVKIRRVMKTYETENK